MTLEKDYTVLFVGEYFSLTGNVTTTNTNPSDIVFEALTFMKEYYGWGNLEEVSEQIIVRDSDGEEIWEEE